MLGLSLNVSGNLSISSVSPIGCPTLVCTTNLSTNSFCFTNCYWKLVCETNTATGQLHCTNVLVCTPRCFTNVFPEIHCTNTFPTGPTRVALRETLSGAVTANAPCDEIAALFPVGGAMFQANLYADLRTNDWRGSHIGSFTITDGTNIVARGSLTGTDGVDSHRLEPCAACNHFEGSLRGLIVQSGPLYGAAIQATYAGNLPNVSCPSSTAPQGATSLSIDGVVVIRCPFNNPRDFNPLTSTTSTTTAE